jgi:hypothetical protein
MLRFLLGCVHQRRGEGGNRTGQRRLLGAFGLVAAVEGAIEQIRVSTEHVLVEAPRYLVDVAGDGSEGCLDDGPGSIAEPVNLNEARFGAYY